MKKLLVLAAALALAVGLCACGSQASSSAASSGSQAAMSASDKSASASQVASASASSDTTNWTETDTADEAAKGAGFERFGVPSRTVIANYTFANPDYSYADHVAQAVYDIPGYVKLTIRKAEGDHKVPLTARDASEFAQTWKETHEGLEVTCYGDEKDDAIIFLWKDGSKEYGATIESEGATKVTMDDEDVDDIVKAVKSAETIQTAEAQKATASAEMKPGFDAQKLAQTENLGQFVAYYAVQGEDGKIYWGIVTKGADGKEVTTYFDGTGNYTNQAMEIGDIPDADSDINANNVAFQYGLGEVQSYYYVQGEGNSGYWAIVTKGSDGSVATTYFDLYGNVVQSGSVEVGDLPDVDAGYNIYADQGTGTQQ